MIASVNPATNETLATFEPLTEAQLEAKLARAAEAFLSYRHTSFPQRARWLTRASEILEAEKSAFGRIMTLEMGKPIEAARQEAAKCALASATTSTTALVFWPTRRSPVDRKVTSAISQSAPCSP